MNNPKNKNIAVNSDTVVYINKLIGPHNEIVGLQVRGKWLLATLKSGVHFSVLNKLKNNV